MGIDLKVMASYFRERRGELLPTATLRFERDPGLFSKLWRDLVPCLAHPLPPDLIGLAKHLSEEDITQTGDLLGNVDPSRLASSCCVTVTICAAAEPHLQRQLSQPPEGASPPA